MDRRPAPTRRALATVALVAASVALHAAFVAGLAGRLGPAAPPAPPPPVEVALLAAPAPPPAPPAAIAPAPVAPARPAPRPRPRPRPPVPVAAAPADAVGPRTSVVDAAPGTDVAAAAPVAPEGVEGSEAGPGPAAEAAPPADEPTGPEPPAPVAAAAPDSDAARAATATPVPPLPASQRHRFRVYWGDYTDERSVARLEYRLVRDGDRYEIRTEGEAEGLISLVYAGTLSQASVGRIGPGGLEPLHYTEQRGKRPERSVAFDPDARRLKPTAGRGEPVWLPPGTQDRLSVFYQVGLLARAEPERFVAGSTRELPVASMRDVRIERFEVVGDETLIAPGGPIRALHLVRAAPPGTDDPRIDLWLGYDFEMLPVRLRVEDAGRRVLDQVIELGG
jgi:hypothetical protein